MYALRRGILFLFPEVICHKQRVIVSAPVEQIMGLKSVSSFYHNIMLKTDKSAVYKRDKNSFDDLKHFKEQAICRKGIAV